MTEGGRPSMFETVKAHGEEIEKLKKESDALTKNQRLLFEWKKEMDKWRGESDANYHDLKTTILTENKETRSFFQSIMDKQWDLIKSTTGMQQELKKADIEIKKVDSDIKRDNWAKGWDFMKTLFAAGGIAYLIFEAFISK
ncbi:hypothetical protein [Bacillus sp. FJAT-22090]|uniref:hypothetical protein n=1 Tax=Bacillus sp. FJAT-22090 TaxID=1581038 RepID=UPI0011A6D601|nr:hypothetical protein [Bacillus sp. FJAT-22090]